MATVVAYRVVARKNEEQLALAGGADEVEPGLTGNLMVRTEGGDFVLQPGEHSAERYSSFAALVPPEEAISDPSVPIERTRQALTQILDEVAAHAKPNALVVLGSGTARRIPDGADRTAGEQRFAATLHLARDLANARGLRVMIEPLARAETNLLHSAAEAASFLDAHQLGDVLIVADLFHAMDAGLDFDELRALAPRVGHVHLADTGRLAPGTGDWPIEAYLTALRAGGYAGDVTIECQWDDFERQLPGALAFVREADARALAAAG